MRNMRSFAAGTGLVGFILLAGLALVNCQSGDGHPDDRAYAKRITEYNELMEGANAYGMPGDWLLYNGKVRVIIADLAQSAGMGLSGGSLIDADIIRKGKDAHGRDAFQETFPTVNLLIPEVDDALVAGVSVANDGSDGAPAVVRVEGEAIPLFTLFAFEGVVGGLHAYQFSTDYILEPNASYVKIVTTVTMNPDGADEVVPIPDTSDPLDVFAHILLGNQVLGDVLINGSSLDVFGPPFGFGEDQLVSDLFFAGVSTFTDPILADFIASVGDDVSYGMATKDGQLSVPIFSASTTAVVGAVSRDNNRFSFERYFIIGDGDVASVLDTLYEIRGVETGTLKGNVLDASTMEPVSGANVLIFKIPDGELLGDDPPRIDDLEAWLLEAGIDDTLPWNQAFLSQAETDVGEDTTFDGSFSADLVPGRYVIFPHTHDRPDPTPTILRVRAGETTTQTLFMPASARLTFTLRDAVTGEGIPGKLTLQGENGLATMSQILGDGFLPDGISYVAYTYDGGGELTLEPGTYDYTFSRGIEYSIDTGTVTVDPRFPANLYGFITQVVDTSGYMSMDFHQHCENSFDSGIKIEKRLITNVVENLEILVGTDHDYITNYRPIVRKLGVEDYIHTIISNELTTFEIGHYIGFPLFWDPMLPGNGAIDWRGMRPQDMFDAFRAIGFLGPENTVTHSAHPRDSILGYYYVYDVDPATGCPGPSGSFMNAFNPLVTAENYTEDYESTEVLNAKRFEIIRTPTTLEYAKMRLIGEESRVEFPECPDCDPGDELPGGGICPAWDVDPEYGSCRVSVYRMMKRTLAEQDGILGRSNMLSRDFIHVLDDWFRDVNLNGTAARTATAGSDSHSAVRTEAGCPRSYLMFSTDKPGLVDNQEVVDRIFDHQVMNTYGPFIEFDIDGHPLGSVHTNIDGAVGLHVRVQSPLWFDVDRIEIYANGLLVHEIDNANGSRTPGEFLDNESIVNFDDVIEIDGLDRDTWFAVIAMGPDPMAPVFTSNEFPYINIGSLIAMALSDESFQVIIDDVIAECDDPEIGSTWWSAIICLVFGILNDPESPIEISDLLEGLLPKSPSSIFPTIPYAQTNAIFVDVDGNGAFDPMTEEELPVLFEAEGEEESMAVIESLTGDMANAAVLKRLLRLFNSPHPFPSRRLR